jgi:ubiquitin carboxyl-terminal hydrolase 5/13
LLLLLLLLLSLLLPILCGHYLNYGTSFFEETKQTILQYKQLIITMEAIEALAGRCRVATPRDTVLHSECAFTFYNPYSTEDGILVNMNTFMGTIPELAFNNVSHDSDIFLRVVKKRIEKPKDEHTSDHPTKLGIGVEGGFSTDDDKYETITKHSIVVMKREPIEVVTEMTFDEESKGKLPEAVVKSAESIIHHVGLAVQQDLTAWQDDEEVPESKYYKDLPFVDNGVKISPDPKTWKCEKSGETENLWLNLSDGYIGGGRRNWDGSGGSNGAVDHYTETGEKYPLVVKLGTITTEGSIVHADCYSYAKDEDGPVKIPNLAELLAKRGIQVSGLQKTEKSTAELEVELNAVSFFLLYRSLIQFFIKNPSPTRLLPISTLFLSSLDVGHSLTPSTLSPRAGQNWFPFLALDFKV